MHHLFLVINEIHIFDIHFKGFTLTQVTWIMASVWCIYVSVVVCTGQLTDYKRSLKCLLKMLKWYSKYPCEILTYTAEAIDGNQYDFLPVVFKVFKVKV